MAKNKVGERALKNEPRVKVYWRVGLTISFDKDLWSGRNAVSNFERSKNDGTEARYSTTRAELVLLADLPVGLMDGYEIACTERRFSWLMVPKRVFVLFGLARVGNGRLATAKQLRERVRQQHQEQALCVLAAY